MRRNGERADMDSAPDPSAASWRERLHRLPPGDDPPAPRWLWVVLQIIMAPLLALMSAGVALLLGAACGLSLGIGPEQSGGAVYVLAGAMGSVFVAVLVALLARGQGASRAFTRYLFFLLECPSFLHAACLSGDDRLPCIGSTHALDRGRLPQASEELSGEDQAASRQTRPTVPGGHRPPQNIEGAVMFLWKELWNDDHANARGRRLCRGGIGVKRMQSVQQRRSGSRVTEYPAR